MNDLSTERNTLNALLETMYDGVVLVAEDDTIVLANEAARQLFDPGFHAPMRSPQTRSCGSRCP